MPTKIVKLYWQAFEVSVYSASGYERFLGVTAVT